MGINYYKYNEEIDNILKDFPIGHHAFIRRNFGEGANGHGVESSDLLFCVESVGWRLYAYWKHELDKNVRISLLKNEDKIRI